MKVKKVVVEDFNEFGGELKDLATLGGGIDYVSVGSLEELYRILTPQRKRLLDIIKNEKPSSLRKLAELVGRDYENVYEDVILLEKKGFLKIEIRGRNLVPVVDYGVIDIQVKVGSTIFFNMKEKNENNEEKERKKEQKGQEEQKEDKGKDIILYEGKENKIDLLIFVEAALSNIPYIGHFLAAYVGEFRQKRQMERIEKYLYYFKERIEELDENKIDYKYLRSEEFAELLIHGLELAAKSATERKIRRFANILVNHVRVDFKFKDRTKSIMSFVDRLSDLDAFVLISYGSPYKKSMRANSKDEAFNFVKKLAEYLGLEIPEKEDVIESIIYLDNLGLTWVNEKMPTEGLERGEDLILKEFSSFRTPLGNEVVKVIIPPDFFIPNPNASGIWPDDIINEKYKYKRTVPF